MVQGFGLLMMVGDVADRDHDFRCGARVYDNSECVQYDACYGASGWVAAEEVRTSLSRDVGMARCVRQPCKRDGMKTTVEISRDGMAECR